MVISSGASLEATGAVVVGDGCRIGAFCKILDNNFHPLRGDRLVQPKPVPVRIGANVVLEDNVILLPGARLGDNVRVQAGSVVSRAIPPDAVVSGFPARVVGRAGPRS